jgi:integrase
VSGNEKRFEIDVADVKRTWIEHVASVAGEGSQVRHLADITIRRFISSFTVTGKPQRLVIDSRGVLQWMIQDAQGKSIRYAAERLATVDQFLRALSQAGLLETSLLTEFRLGFGKPSWQRVVKALQSEESEKGLANLRTPAPPPGPLAVYVNSYIDLHQSLGKNYAEPRIALSDLDRFLQTQGVISPQAIQRTMIEHWVNTLTCTIRVRVHKARFVRRFFDYLRTLSIVVLNPVPRTLTSFHRLPRSSFKPFIFTQEQLAALLEKAKLLPETPQCRAPHTYFTMLALLCSLGLRHGEARHLRVRDLDLARQTLFINQTKFHKSRLIPFGAKVGQCLAHYFEIRRTRIQPVQEDDPLFTTWRRKPIATKTLLDVFRRILHTLGIEGIPGQNPPRLHDLRHTFAVHRLLRWYREGVDVQSRLPALATFMGHVQPQSTEIYLTITADLLHEANARFFHHFGRPGGQEA